MIPLNDLKYMCKIGIIFMQMISECLKISLKDTWNFWSKGKVILAKSAFSRRHSSWKNVVAPIVLLIRASRVSFTYFSNTSAACKRYLVVSSTNCTKGKTFFVSLQLCSGVMRSTRWILAGRKDMGKLFWLSFSVWSIKITSFFN